MLSDTRGSSSDTDRCHRPVVVPDNPSRDIVPRYRFHEHSLHIYRILFSDRTFCGARRYAIREIALRPSRAFRATQIPLTYCYIDFFNGECSRLFHAHLFSVRSRRHVGSFSKAFPRFVGSFDIRGKLDINDNDGVN